MPIDQPTALKLQTRARTILELPPQMSAERMLVNGAAGQSQDGYTTLTLSDDAAELLAQILVRYNSAVADQGPLADGERIRIRVDEDHDVAFWDAIACDLLVATEIPPPASGRTVLAYSLGRTADR